MSQTPIDVALITDMLDLQKQERLPHAILLVAPFGFALKGNAKAIAKSLLCQQQSANGCGACKPCQAFENQSHGDYRRLAQAEGKASIGVDQVREACDFVAQTSGYGDLKLLIVDGADKMTVPAANALLKTLEEPQGNSLILLTAEFSWALPATIRSRCQQRIIKPPARELLEAFLTNSGQGSISSAVSDYELLRMAAYAEHSRPQFFQLADSILDALITQQIDVSQAYSQLDKTDTLETVNSLLHATESTCARESDAPNTSRLLALLELQQVLGAVLRRLRLGSTPAKEGLIYQICTLIAQVGRGDLAAVAESKRLLGINT